MAASVSPPGWDFSMAATERGGGPPGSRGCEQVFGRARARNPERKTVHSLVDHALEQRRMS